MDILIISIVVVASALTLVRIIDLFLWWYYHG